MRLLHLLTISALVLVVACDSSETFDLDLGEVPSDLVGTWIATSLTVSDVDLVAAGATFEITFTANNNYQFITFNSPEGFFCDEVTSCSNGGLFSVQGDTFIFDADDADPADRTELNITTFSATTIVLDGSIDTEDILFVFGRK